MANGSYTTDTTLLDVEVPTTTKNFIVNVLTGNTSTLKVQATRANNGVVTTGTNAYGLIVNIDSNGTITRTCCGDQTLCKALKVGNDWTWSSSTCTTVSGGSSGGAIPSRV